MEDIEREELKPKVSRKPATWTAISAIILAIILTIATNAYLLDSIAKERSKSIERDEELSSEISDVQLEITRARTNISELQTDMISVQSTIIDLQSNIAGLQSNIADIQNAITGIQSEIAELRSNVSSLQADIANMMTTIANIQQSISDIQGDITSLQSSLLNIETRVSTLENDISSIQATILDMENRISILESFHDNDGDGIFDMDDPDDDDDGVLDENDVFPFDPTESSDNDHDGIGDNADTDDDDDGIPDTQDLFPNKDAKLKITFISFVLQYTGSGDIYFVMFIDDVYLRTKTLYNTPAGTETTINWEYVYNIPDDLSTIDVYIQMWDDDLLEPTPSYDDIQDIDGTGASYGLMLYYDVLAGTWTGDDNDGYTNGSDDGRSGEQDATLRYDLETV